MKTIKRTVTFEDEQLAVDLRIDVGRVSEDEGSRTYHLPEYYVDEHPVPDHAFDRILAMLALRSA